MKTFEWNQGKNLLLKKERNISFEEIIKDIAEGRLLDRVKHPNKDKYPNQFVFYINHKNYVYAVPFVEDKNKIFLKTIYPDRVATKKYLEDSHE